MSDLATPGNSAITLSSSPSMVTSISGSRLVGLSKFKKVLEILLSCFPSSSVKVRKAFPNSSQISISSSSSSSSSSLFRLNDSFTRLLCYSFFFLDISMTSNLYFLFKPLGYQNQSKIYKTISCFST